MLIAHISDLHLNSFYNDSIFKRINYLLKNLQAKKVDHLIVTGDITDNASEKDFIIFRRMLNRYGFLNGDRVSIVPGNHDIFGGVQKAEDIFNFPRQCSQVNYNKKINEFINHFPEAFNNSYYISQNEYFPFAKIIDKTLLVGFNSIATYSKMNNPFGSNGEVSASQFSEILNILKNADKNLNHRIVLVHHHFNKTNHKSKSTFGNLWSRIEKQTMKLRNKRRMFKVFQDYKIDIVLHGHIHESKHYFRKGIRFLNAGATIKNGKNYLRVNFLKLNEDSIDVEIKKVGLPKKIKKESSLAKKFQDVKLIHAA